MLVVHVPRSRTPEREYVTEVLLGEFLGMEYRLEPHSEKNVRITLDGSAEPSSIVMPDVFFAAADDKWLDPGSLPAAPLPIWHAHHELPEANLVESSLPVIFGQEVCRGTGRDASSRSVRIRRHSEGIDLGLDIFGSAFFMLTRYEEVAAPVFDKHARYPAAASLASRERFLDRPIINEYLEVLWACMKRLWPTLRRMERIGEIHVSHDVDWPLIASGNASALLLSSVSDVIRRQSPATAVRRIRAYLGRKCGNFDHDPYNTFDMVMDISERHGLRSTFNFITDNTAGPIDGEYDLGDPWIRALLTDIHERGHEIGLHPSYDSFQNAAQIRKEFERLLEAAGQLGISQGTWGGRQHYLRWEAPTTWQAWDDAGLHYDSTVGYADRPGFRAGTCYQYSTFNLVTRTFLGLKERPLITMDATLVDKQYLGLSYEQALEDALELRARCLRFNGSFTLLWHNSHFLTRWDVPTYEALVSA